MTRLIKLSQWRNSGTSFLEVNNYFVFGCNTDSTEGVSTWYYKPRQIFVIGEFTELGEHATANS